MPHGLRNWTYKDVIKFLRAHDFVFSEELEGSHEAWIKTSSNPPAVVEVDFKKGSHSYPPKTLETLIRQSCLEKKGWRDWAGK